MFLISVKSFLFCIQFLLQFLVTFLMTYTFTFFFFYQYLVKRSERTIFLSFLHFKTDFVGISFYSSLNLDRFPTFYSFFFKKKLKWTRILLLSLRYGLYFHLIFMGFFLFLINCFISSQKNEFNLLWFKCEVGGHHM